MIYLLLIISLFTSSCSFFMNDDPLLPYQEQTSAGLPVFYLDPKPVSKDFYTPCSVIYKGTRYEAEGKIRGGFSAYFPKKSYTLRFSDTHLFSDPDMGDEGFTQRKKVFLLADFDDNSHLRNRLAQRLWQLLQDDGTGTYHSPVIQTSSAVVYTNGSYEGLYTVVDPVDETMIDRYAAASPPNLVKPMIPGGDMFKGNTRDANFYLHSEVYKGFDKVMGTPGVGIEGAFTPLEEFILFLNHASDSEFADPITGFHSRANVDSYYGWWFYTSFMAAADSVNKNAFHYKEPGGLWYYFPWDFNASFGQRYNTKRIGAYFQSGTSDNKVFQRLVYHPSYAPAQHAQYRALLEPGGAWELPALLEEVDSLWAEVREAALEDWDKWEDKHKSYSAWKDRSDFTTPEEEVEYIKAWIGEMHGRALGRF
ncbi:MAG: CotH kinase family protein [Spirochaetales bacterium]|nr:CotH kinase family protein [Spirochaetales bacterium]